RQRNCIVRSETIEHARADQNILVENGVEPRAFVELLLERAVVEPKMFAEVGLRHQSADRFQQLATNYTGAAEPRRDVPFGVRIILKMPDALRALARIDEDVDVLRRRVRIIDLAVDDGYLVGAGILIELRLPVTRQAWVSVWLKESIAFVIFSFDLKI